MTTTQPALIEDEAVSRWGPPKKLVDAVGVALASKRAFIVNHGVDTGDSPFVTLTAKWEGHEVRITWHTRTTGTYRLFSALAQIPRSSWHDVTLSRALEIIREADDQPAMNLEAN